MTHYLIKDKTIQTKNMTTDSHECEILKAKIKKFIGNTDYTVTPTIPKHLGKVDFSKQKPVAPAAISPAAISPTAKKLASPVISITEKVSSISPKALHKINSDISNKHIIQQVPTKIQTRARTKQLPITDDE